MRTVANGLITQALIDTQNASGRVPYIDLTIDGTNYWSRLEYIEYHEEAYRDRAIIGLNNRDNALDSLDLDGEEFNIKWGADSSGQGGSATDTVTYPELTVKSHQIISVMGNRTYQIYAEGMWMEKREQLVLSGVTGDQPTYSNTFNATHTVYELLELIIENAMGFNLDAIGLMSDGIVDVFRPVFDVNRYPFENAAGLVYRLLWMTKEYLRQRSNHTWTLLYPQEDDVADKTYYTNQAPYCEEYVEKTILLIPNSIVVLANQDPDTLEWDTAAYPLIVGTASDSAQIAKYKEVIKPFVAASIRTQTDADNRASAILHRLKQEVLGGKAIMPHDSQLELYDKIDIVDVRT